MSRLSSRIDKLLLKTHEFFSAKDLSLMRDYYKVILDENNAKAEDFQREIDQLKKMFEEYTKDKSIDLDQKVQEITKGNDLIHYAFHYQAAIEDCEKYLKGIWMPKIIVKNKLQFLQQAKEYFNKKKKFGY